MSIKIMSSCWDLHGISPPQKLVLLSLADQSNDVGVCWPSAASTATRTGLNERSVRRAISDLESRGHLTRKFQTGKPTYYHIHPCHAVTPDTLSPLTESPKPLTEDTNTPDRGVNITVINPKEPPIDLIVDAYHRILPELPPIRKITPKRRAAIKARCKDGKNWNDIEFWELIFQEVRKNPHNLGHNDRGWKAHIDYITRQDVFIGLYEKGCCK